MKQSIIQYLFFYLYIAGLACTLQANTMQEIPQGKAFIDLCTTLHTIKKIQRDIENLHEQQSQEDQIVQQDCVTDIMIILIGTYEKMIGATVTYYLMMNLPIQQNLHQTIAIILADDIIKIINILGKQLLQFIFNHQISWQKKVWYCAWIVSIIAVIKIGIDQIPQSIQPQQFNIINDDKSSYLKDKFSNYK